MMLITEDYELVCRHVSGIVDGFLLDARDAVENTFGEGSAYKHPELAVAYMNAIATVFSSYVKARARAYVNSKE